MNLPALLTLAITILTGLVGIVFMFFPDWISRIEDRLNARWGDREIASLRLGLRGEQTLEQTLNQDVLTQRFTWDKWAANHSRLTGIALCLAAALLWWQL